VTEKVSCYVGFFFFKEYIHHVTYVVMTKRQKAW